MERFVQTCFICVFLMMCAIDSQKIMENDDENDPMIVDEINKFAKNDNVSRNLWFNPVLQNLSALFDFLAKSRRGEYQNIFQPEVSGKIGSRRNKRSVSRRSCNGLCSRSLCPWTEGFDDDPDRIPRFIPYAVCASTDCNYSMRGVSPSVVNRLQQYTYCDKVRTDFMVLEDNEQRWLTDWPIACICTRHRTRQTDVFLNSMSAATYPLTGMNADTSGITRTSSRVRNTQLSGNSGSGRRHHPSIGTSAMTREQRRQLRLQQRAMRHRSETFEELMARRRQERRQGRNRET